MILFLINFDAREKLNNKNVFVQVDTNYPEYSTSHNLFHGLKKVVKSYLKRSCGSFVENPTID